MEMTLGLISSNYEGIKPVVNVRMSPQSERSRQTRRFNKRLLDFFCAILAQSLVTIIVMIKVAIKASRQFPLLGAFAILAAPR